MQAFLETTLGFVYLGALLGMGVTMLLRNKASRQHIVFGLMAVLLALGSGSYLLPRCIALISGRMESYSPAMSVGRMVAWITLAVFYILLYHVWQLRYQVLFSNIYTVAIYILAALHIALALIPRDLRLVRQIPTVWIFVSALPLMVMGGIVLVLFFRYARRKHDLNFAKIWLAIGLSFAGIIPLALLGEAYPLVELAALMNMIGFVWMIRMSFQDLKEVRRVRKYYAYFTPESVTSRL